jgi:hypothetical protein
MNSHLLSHEGCPTAVEDIEPDRVRPRHERGLTAVMDASLRQVSAQSGL